MKLILTTTLCLFFLSCSEPLPVEQEITLGDSYAKTCNPNKPPKTEGACAAAGGKWTGLVDIGDDIEDPADDTITWYCDCTPVIDL